MTVVQCTYDPEQRQEAGYRKKSERNDSLGSASHAQKAEVRLYENLIDEEKVYIIRRMVR